MSPSSGLRASKRSRLLLSSTALATILIGCVFIWLGLQPVETDAAFVGGLSAVLAGALVLAAGGAALVWASWGSHRQSPQFGLTGRVETWLIEWNQRDDTLSPRWRAINLVLVTFLGLFFELALIRWLGAEIKIFAYLKNVVLIAAFLGLGLGYALAQKRVGLLPLFLPFAACITGIVLLGNWGGLWSKPILPDGGQLVLLGLSVRQANAAPLLLQLVAWIPYYAITVVFFLLVALAFIPLGQYTGKCMRSFAPIAGYSLNLWGSLAGTLLFTGVSFLWLPPGVWFIVAALLAIVQLRNAPRFLWRLNLLLALIFVGALAIPNSEIWSPYHNLRLTPLTLVEQNGKESPWGYQLGIGSYYYQDLANLSRAFLDEHPDMPPAFRHSEYEVPYQFIAPREVLVLGAGTGNDVSAALRNGAEAVDAVDIDPAILKIGEQYHPEKPYSTSRVTPIADDARSYVRKSSKSYDLVLFGLLDSQQVLSAFGSVRLDNFVYTVEGVRDAFRLVKPNGMMTITFQIFQPWMAGRISALIEEATGSKPTVIDAHHGTVFLVRKGSPISPAEVNHAIARMGSQPTILDAGTNAGPLPTDDWPFLYLRSRELPLAYLTILPILALLAVVMIRRVFATGAQIHWHFFALGAAFMLMEVRVIGQIALLFGSTWVVNAVAITSILLMAILANLLVSVRRFENIAPWGLMLLLTLTISSVIPSGVFLSWNQGIGGVAAALLLALPVFFASVVFSILFRKTSAPDVALASNLAGSILGGMTEYLSIVLGMGSLAWIAAVFYVLALVAAREGRVAFIRVWRPQ